MPVEPVFSPPIQSRSLAWWLTGGSGNTVRLLVDLAAVRTDFLDNSWVVFVESALWTQLVGWALWIQRFRPSRSPSLVLMLRYSYFIPGSKQWANGIARFRMALRLLERVARNYPVRLVTDSDLLVREYRILTDLPVAVIPIPHTSSLLSNHCRDCQQVAKTPVNMVMLGRQSLSKGFGTLVEAIIRLHQEGKLSGLNFTIQYYEAFSQDPQVAHYAELLKDLNSPSVRLVEGTLSTEEYHRLLLNADVVLIPYLRDHYYAGTSGAFTEALAKGKPVVVTDGTWMSEQLANDGAGVTFRDREPEDLARAICFARDNCPHLTKQATAHREKWVAYHNPDTFLTELLRIAQKS